METTPIVLLLETVNHTHDAAFRLYHIHYDHHNHHDSIIIRSSHRIFTTARGEFQPHGGQTLI